MSDPVPARPLPDGYWAEPGRLYAGEYPGHPDPDAAAARVGALLDAGLDWFVDLTWPDELPPYAPLLPSPYSPGPRRAVVYSRRPIRDHAVPREPLQMVEILDELDEALRHGHRVYVHCRAGIGRTGTVVGCWLARRLGSGTAALAALDELWRNAGRLRVHRQTPETDEQIAYVRDWLRHDAPVAVGPAGAVPGAMETSLVPPRPPTVPTPTGRSSLPAGPGAAAARHQGLVFGLAIGDALGMPVEGRRAGEFAVPPDLSPGGPYGLPAGAWTDDAALALLYAESLLERGTSDARDQLGRYARYLREGLGASAGRGVGLGGTAARAIAHGQWTGNPYAGPHDPTKAEKDPLTRAAIAAAWAADDPEQAVQLAAEAARVTHQAPVALDACRYYAGLVVGALRGATREALLAPGYAPVPGLWERRPLKPEIARIAVGGWRDVAPVPTGSAADALAIALWALGRGPTWRDAVAAAVALGGDAAAHGAITGALAGALYGSTAIPPHWRSGVAGAERLAGVAERLRAAVEARAGGAPAPRADVPEAFP